MKKILFAVCLIFSSFVAFSQDDNDDNHLNGIRAGYQHSNLVNDDADAASNLDEYYIGICRQKKFSPLFRLETGLDFFIAGAKVTDDTKLKLSYLAIPVNLLFKLGPFVAMGGINADFKVGEKLTFMGNDVDLTDENKTTFMDCAADVGAGFKLFFLTIEGRYYWGLVDIKDGWHNQYFQVGLKANF